MGYVSVLVLSDLVLACQLKTQDTVNRLNESFQSSSR